MKTQIIAPVKSSWWIAIRNWILADGVLMLKKPYAKIYRRKRTAWQLTSDQLCKMPAGSLGNRLGLFLKEGDYELFPKLEKHDAMHVLLGYGTTVEEEAMMQFVLFGNGKRNIFCLTGVFLAWLTIPECRDEFLKAYLRGRALRKFTKWKFEHLLKEPLDVLQKLITIPEKPTTIAKQKHKY